MNPLLEVLCNEINKLKKALTTTGSDYTATVTKVEGDTAYVQMSGSDISDTPVALSVNADVGDHVRVRVANGKAWITGNDTLPPSNDKKEVGTKMMKDMSDRDEDIVIDFGKMEFLGNTLVVDSKNFKLDEDGGAKFSGTLEAASGTFGGMLEAASGTFAGKVDITWHPEDGIDYTTNVVIGQNSYRTQNLYPGISVIEVNGEQGGYTVMAAAETTYYATNTVLSTLNVTGYGIFIAEGSKWAQLTVDGVRTSSDRRLKEDITKIDPETAKHLLPVRFRFKDDDKIHYGFIAQDVQKIIPDAVTEDKNGYLSLNYQELIAPLYALVQEQEDRIDRLEAQLKALEEKR